MRRLLFAVAILASFIMSAQAEKLTVGQVALIHTALSQMVCKDEKKETTACVPLDKTGLVWQIAANQAKAAEVVNRLQNLHNQYLVGLPRKPDGTLTDDALARIAVKDAELFEQEAKIELEPFKRVDLEPFKLPA